MAVMGNMDIGAGFALLTAVLVVFMQTGFALLETGSARSRDAQNVFMKNIMDMCFGSLAFFAIGYALSSGDDVGGIMGGSKFFLADAEPEDHLRFFYNYSFATNAATIFGGAVAGRTRFMGFVTVASVVAGLLYPIVVHWVWHNGWLSKVGENGVIDFAGSCVVHLTGGVVGFVGACIVGPRMGRFERPHNPYRPHNAVLAATGVMLLWVCWFGFNMAGASFVQPDKRADVAALVAVNTTLSAAMAAVAVFVIRRTIHLPYSLGSTGNAALSGLVAITAPCACVRPWAALLIGFIAGSCYVLSSVLLVKLKIDDPLDAAPVHMFCGAWGTLSVGLFADATYLQNSLAMTTGVTQYGLFMGGGIQLLGTQLVGVVATMLWVGLGSLALFLLLRRMQLLRVDPSTEAIGMDLAKHSMVAYPEYVLQNPTNRTAARTNAPLESSTVAIDVARQRQLDRQRTLANEASRSNSSGDGDTTVEGNGAGTGARMGAPRHPRTPGGATSVNSKMNFMRGFMDDGDDATDPSWDQEDGDEDGDDDADGDGDADGNSSRRQRQLRAMAGQGSSRSNGLDSILSDTGDADGNTGEGAVPAHAGGAAAAHGVHLQVEA